MPWPTVAVGTTNTDAGTDSPASARANIHDAILKLNDFIVESAAGGGFVLRNGTNTMTAPLREPGRVSIATAATINLQTAASRIVSLTGTTTVTAVTLGDGQWAIGIAAAAFQLTNSATLVVQGAANYTTAAGDVLLFTGEPSSVVRVSIMRANGAPVGVASQAQAEAGTDNSTAMTSLRTAQAIRAQNITLGTVQATASGTQVDFTGIPSWAKRVTLMLNGFSVSAASTVLIQLGDSGGIETTGYLASSSALAGASTTNNSFTTGFGMILNPADVINGAISVQLLDPATNLWVCSGSVAYSSQAATYLVSGGKSLSAVLDRVRLSTGAGAFDAGSVNISWE